MDNSPNQPGYAAKRNPVSLDQDLIPAPCPDILAKRLAYEHLLYKITMLAVENSNLKKYLEKCLRLLGETLSVSRIYIFEHDYFHDTMNNTYEWVNSGITVEKENLQNIAIGPDHWWVNQLKANCIVNFSDIEDIPDKVTRETLRPQHIKSILVVPLFINNIYFGFIGFDECITYRTWPQEDVDLLTTIANIITQVIVRYNSELTLERERKQLLSIFNSINEPIYVADMDTYEILFANKAIQQTYNQPLIGQICYTALQNKTKPCEFCTNQKIRKLGAKPYRWEHYNLFARKYFQIIDRMISWPDGRKVRFEMAIDITDRKKAEVELQNEKNLLNITLLSIGDGVITTNIFGKIVMLNKVAEDLTGWKQPEAENKDLDEVFKIINESTRLSCESPVIKVLSSRQKAELGNHTILISRDGYERVVSDSAAPIVDSEGDIKGVVLVFRDITEKNNQQKAIYYLSCHDSLTGLYNRAFLEKEMKRLDAENNLPISVIMGDVNGLKITNDVFGHKKGDWILKNIARIMQESCRSQDILSRWGGDEFVILLPGTSPENAEKVIQRIQESCAQAHQGKLLYSISLGSSAKTVAEKNMESILKEAEEAMYQHKLIEGKRLRNFLISTIKATLHEKGYETYEHTGRVQQLAVKIGQAMQLSPHNIKDLRLLADLHDIGLYPLRDSTLAQAGPLSRNDWVEIKKHPEIGYRIAQSIPEITSIAQYILYHHEHWDGRGYPQGLKGADIPLLSRIIAVADAWDTMRNEQIYRKALSYEEAVQELKNHSGTQFDPQIVDIFIYQVLSL